jgi:hypothetical protein
MDSKQDIDSISNQVWAEFEIDRILTQSSLNLLGSIMHPIFETKRREPLENGVEQDGKQTGLNH